MDGVSSNAFKKRYIILKKFVCCERIIKRICAWYCRLNKIPVKNKVGKDIKIEDVNLEYNLIRNSLKLYFSTISEDQQQLISRLFTNNPTSAKSIRNSIAHNLPNKTYFSSNNFKQLNNDIDVFLKWIN